jgi:hypothetical protein
MSERKIIMPLQITISELELYTRNGQSYCATTGQLTTGADSTVGVSIFNPVSSDRNILIYSVRFSNNIGSSMLNLYKITADPAYANAFVVNNMSFGGPQSAIATNCTYQNSTVSVVGTKLDISELPQSNGLEQLSNGALIWLPEASANGLALYDFVANGGAWSSTIRWIEM